VDSPGCGQRAATHWLPPGDGLESRGVGRVKKNNPTHAWHDQIADHQGLDPIHSHCAILAKAEQF